VNNPDLIAMKCVIAHRGQLAAFPTALAACLLAINGLAGASQPQWPQFRGPNSSGVAQADKPPIEFGPATNLLWKIEVPNGLSSPVVWGDRIFLTAVAEDKLVTLCLNRRDGKLLWRQAVTAEKPREIHKKNHPATATAATDGERVCVYFPTFGLLGYDVEGRELWRKPMPGLFARNGSGTSPALLNGSLVLNCDVEENKSFLVAFDPANGKERWRTARAEFLSSYTTPVLWQHDERDELIIVGSLRVVAYGLSDGKQRWFASGTEAVSVCPTPVIGDGQLYVMSRSFGGARLPPFAVFALSMDKDGDGKISREEAPRPFLEQGAFTGIDLDQDGFITEKEWEQAVVFLNKADYGIFAVRAPGKESQGDLTETHVAWKHRKGVAPVTSPLFYHGRIYVVQDGGRVTGIEAKGGKKLFEQERIGADGDYYASPVAADGKIYFCSTRGTVTVVAAGDALQVLTRNELAESIMATPAIADNKLYVRSGGHLWAFGVP